jgi:hypothetical protein
MDALAAQAQQGWRTDGGRSMIAAPYAHPTQGCLGFADA